MGTRLNFADVLQLIRSPKIGAGVLYVYYPPGGSPELLLGKRRQGWDASTWSVTGGYRNQGESARDNAFREAREEGCDIKTAGESRLIGAVHFPFLLFRWRTYLVQLATKPPTHLWPVETADFRKEFYEMRWFPLSELPQPLHIGIRYALKWNRFRPWAGG